MAPQDSPITILAGENLEPNRRVLFNGTAWFYADASEKAQAITMQYIANAGYGSARLINAGGVSAVESATTLTAGATAYGADDGKVTSTVTGFAFGIVETAPIAASNPARIITTNDGPVMLAATVAASTAISNTNTETAFDQTVTLKANTLRAGDGLDIFALARMTATNSTDTFVFKVKIGSNILMATGTIDAVNDDVAVIHGRVQIRTAGASGTMISGGLTYNGTASSAAGAADIPSGTHMASATIDTTADNTLSVTCTQSVASTGNSARLEMFQVSRLPKA